MRFDIFSASLCQIKSRTRRMAIDGWTLSAIQVLCRSNMKRMQVVRLCWRGSIASPEARQLVKFAVDPQGAGLKRAAEASTGGADKPSGLSLGNPLGRFLTTLLEGYSEPLERNPGFRML
jgi:hypothetical protein